MQKVGTSKLHTLLAFTAFLLLNTSALYSLDGVLALDAHGNAYIKTSAIVDPYYKRLYYDTCNENHPYSCTLIPLENIGRTKDGALFINQNNQRFFTTARLQILLYKKEASIFSAIQKAKGPFVSAIAPIAYNRNKAHVLLEKKPSGAYGLIQAEDYKYPPTHTTTRKVLNSKTGYAFGIPSKKLSYRLSKKKLEKYKKSSTDYLESLPKNAFNIDKKERVFPTSITYISTKKLSNATDIDLRWAQLIAIRNLKAGKQSIDIGQKTITLEQSTIAYLQNPRFPQLNQQK